MVRVPVKKIARIVGEALRDADRARRDASDPAFGKDVRRDRRGTLSRYRTVQHALRDRERIEKDKAANDTKAAAKGAKPAAKTTAVKAAERAQPARETAGAPSAKGTKAKR